MNNLVLVCSLALVCLSTSGVHSAIGQSTRSGINWGELCRNTLVDPLIAEPCNSLTSPDGYQLTQQGNRVLYCILAGGIGKLVGLSDDDLKQLAPVAGCGPNPNSNEAPTAPNAVIEQNMTIGTDMSNTTMSGNMTGDATVASVGASVTITPGSSSPGNGKDFVPDTLTTSTGTAVTWTNGDVTLHTVTSGSPEAGNSGTEFDSSYLAAGKTFQHQFSTAGTFDYYCTLHPFMTGKVIVS